MSLVTYSPHRVRVYQRRFDHDEMRMLRATSEWTQQALADHYGVHISRIRQLLNPRLKAENERYSREWFAAICDDCGGPCSHNWSSKHARHDRVVCRSCADERRREENLLSRLDAAGDIHCAVCGEHRPIGDYRMKPNGYPAGRCRPCEAAARREHRHRNIEAYRAWEREYKRRRRAAK